MRHPKQIVYFIQYACCLLLSGLIFSACTTSFFKDDHPEYFNSVFKKFDSTADSLKTKAIDILDAAFYAFPHPGTGDKFERFKRKRDFYYYVKQDFSRSFLYSDSIAFLLKDKTGDERFADLYSQALLFKGDIYFTLKNYMEGFHYYTLGRQVVLDKMKNPYCASAGYDSRIANMYYRQGRYRLAVPYYLRDFEVQAVCNKEDNFNKFSSQQANLDNAGLSYMQTGMLDSALYFFNAALNYIEKEEHRFAGNASSIKVQRAVIYGNLGNLLAKRKQFAEAEVFFKKSMEGTAQADVGYTQYTRLNLAEMYLANGYLQNAANALVQLKTSLDSFPNMRTFINWHKLKAAYYDKKGQLHKAGDYLFRYTALMDSFEVKNLQFNALDVNNELEVAEKKSINEALKKDSHLKTLYLLVATIISAMSIVIILLVWYNLKRNSKHAGMLEALNLGISNKNNDLQQTLLSLEQSHRDNTKIMKIVAHDLKNPISAIRNLVYSLLKKDLQRELKEILELIKTSCTSSLALINDLLTERKQLAEIRKEMVDMSKLLQYCVDLLQAKADEKNQQLVLHADTAVMMLNRQKMWRVISNIVNNAIKFSPENTAINIRLEKKETTILLSIQDNGIGIPGDLKDKIFTLSPESSRPGTAGEESYGLGLAISQKIVEEHQGKIWFESKTGEGSIFYIELPCYN